MEVKMWILSGVIAAGSAILWWAIRKAVDGIYQRLDRMIDQGEKHGQALVAHEGELKSLDRRVSVNENRLNDHGDRLRTLEMKTK